MAYTVEIWKRFRKWGGIPTGITQNVKDQLSYVTHSGKGEGLLFDGNIILPFVDRFPKDTELYRIMTTKPQEQATANGTEV